MASLTKVRKRDGSIEGFDKNKIRIAIEKALAAVRYKNPKIADKLAFDVVRKLEKELAPNVLPTVEDVQDVVEEVLMKNRLVDAARAYILYREKHKEIRDFKTFLGVRDELKLSENAIAVLAKRYLLRDDEGNVVETPLRLFKRVAKAVAEADQKYEKGVYKRTEDVFFELMSNLDFVPNSPTLMNAGTDLGQLSACFVLPIDDSLDSIFTTLKNMAMVHQSGGGTGFDFSNIRPEGDIVKITKGIASGPVSFMRIFDTTTDVIKQGGRRRGANMGIMRFNHPDILDFVTSKTKFRMDNFNISVSATDDFMKSVIDEKDVVLVNPRTKRQVRKLNAKELFDIIVASAWRSGDPGLVFIDEINRRNTTSFLGEITSTNPCGEQPLHPYESCNLGSINLSRIVRKGKIDYQKLKKVVHDSVHFLDNVIDVNKYPLDKIREITLANRRIGLGIMGFAELLVLLDIPYDSDKALRIAEQLMKFINDEAKKASRALAKQRGPFPNSVRASVKDMRNATVTTIAPTGTISIIAGVTSGIEPIFAVCYVRNVLEGMHLLESNPLFERIAREKGFYSKGLMMRIAKTGSVQGLKEVPKNVQKLFKTANEIRPEWHIRMQAAFQKYCDNAVSKTINLSEDASQKEIAKAFLLAHKLKCKGITVYRYGSKEGQVLVRGGMHVLAGEEYAGDHLCKECTY